MAKNKEKSSSDNVEDALGLLKKLVDQQQELAAVKAAEASTQLSAQILGVLIKQFEETLDFNRRNNIPDCCSLMTSIHFILVCGHDGKPDKPQQKTMMLKSTKPSGPRLLTGGCTTDGCEPLQFDLDFH